MSQAGPAGVAPTNTATLASTRLVMLARVPVLGRVKSRLARHIGAAQALRAHLQLLEENAFIAQASGMPFELHVVGDTEMPWFAGFRRRLAAPVLQQGPGDIGAKMLFAARHSAAGNTLAGSGESVPSIIIGSDCGALSVDYLQDAAQQLERAQVVLGAAEDGGYALIGQRKPYPQLFSGVSWGTDRVAAQTRKLALAADLKLAELPLQWDVDGVADWRRWSRITD